MSYLPLFCGTVSIMNLMCRYSPFGECDAVGISSFKNIPQISYLGNVKIFDFNPDSTQATLWERFYPDQGLNQYSGFLPELFRASRILFQSKYGNIRPESIPSII